MDDIAARFPERITGANDPLRFALQFEQHFASDHIPEHRAGVAVSGSTPGARLELDRDSDDVGGTNVEAACSAWPSICSLGIGSGIVMLLS